MSYLLSDTKSIGTFQDPPSIKGHQYQEWKIDAIFYILTISIIRKVIKYQFTTKTPYSLCPKFMRLRLQAWHIFFIIGCNVIQAEYGLQHKYTKRYCIVQCIVDTYGIIILSELKPSFTIGVMPNGGDIPYWTGFDPIRWNMLRTRHKRNKRLQNCSTKWSKMPTG